METNTILNKLNMFFPHLSRSFSFVLFLFLFYVSIQAQDENTKIENKVTQKESPNTITTKENPITDDSKKDSGNGQNGQIVPVV